MGTKVSGLNPKHVETDAGTDEADAVILAVPHELAAGLAPPGTVDADALARLGTSPIVNLHIHYDRRVLPEPLAAALDSPVQWIFDRTAASGASEGQLVAVSLSHATGEIGIGGGASRALPSGARARAARDGRCRRDRLRGYARAARDLRRGARHAQAPAGHGHTYPRGLPRRSMDGHGLARNDGGRGTERARGGDRRDDQCHGETD